MVVKIVQKGNKILRQKAREVPLKEIKSRKIKNLLKNMAKILAVSKDGVALAAPQIGESLRIFIIDGNVWGKIAKEEKELPPAVFINPIIKKISKKKQLVNEGCLSAEGIYGTIKRAEKLTIEAYDENARKFHRGVSGLSAQIIQHEIDHLNGVLFLDKAIKLEKIKKEEL